MYFTSGSDRAFEQLMQGKPGFDHYDSGEAVTPEDCGTCRFYRPHWKYQFCVYAECPYQPGKLTAYDAVTFRVKQCGNPPCPAADRKPDPRKRSDASILREFVDKIYISEVYTPEENEPRIKVREIEIVYNFIGAFDFEEAREQSQAAQKEKKTGVA